MKYPRVTVCLKDIDSLDYKLQDMLGNQDKHGTAIRNILKGVIDLFPEGIDFSRMTVKEIKNMINIDNSQIVPCNTNIQGISEDSYNAQNFTCGNDDYINILANNYDGIVEELSSERTKLLEKKRDINDSLLQERIKVQEPLYFPKDYTKLHDFFGQSISLQIKAIEYQNLRIELDHITSEQNSIYEKIAVGICSIYSMKNYDSKCGFNSSSQRWELRNAFYDYSKYELSKIEIMDKILDYQNEFNILLRVKNEKVLCGVGRLLTRKKIGELLQERDSIIEPLSSINTSLLYFSLLRDFYEVNNIVTN